MLVNSNALNIPLAAGSVQAVITSPPYFGLRDYGEDGQLGLEPLHDCLGWATGDNCGGCYVCTMRRVFAEVWRVLRDDGTLWLNLGDSYSGGGGFSPTAPSTNHSKSGKYGITGASMSSPGSIAGLKSKNLVGIPWRVALALQADGWILRQDIIWHKPNPMPESVTDRCTKAHEYVFLLSKQGRYYYDAEAVKENAVCDAGTAGTWDGNRDFSLPGGLTRFGKPNLGGSVDGKRNRRSVWTVATRPYSGAHFAVFPPDLVEPMILAGTSSRGCCPTCRAPWERVVERPKPPPEVYTKSGKPDDIAAVFHPELGKAGMGQKLQDWYNKNPAITTGWEPSCNCPENDPVPCIVLDPFAGSGTLGRVAIEHGRRPVLCDLNFDYLAEQATARTSAVQVNMLTSMGVA